MAELKSSIFSTIKNVAGYITASGVIIVMMWNTFKFIDSANKTSDQIKILSLKVDTLTNAINNVSTQGVRLGRMIIELNQEVSDEAVQSQKYHQSYIKYVRDNTKTSQELFRYIEGLDLEVKKN